jgi:hypothetical protein
MTTTRQFGRIGPVTWLVLQAVATVASILLAFGIDAWWDQRNAAAEKNVVLESVKAEMLSDLNWVKDECAYRKASIDSVEILLEAVAAGRYEDTERTLDRRLADMTWYNGLGFSTGAVSSLLSSGRAAAIEDTKLRALLAGYPAAVAWLSDLGRRDQKTMLEVLTPFLSRNANLLQISNESYRHGMPPDGLLAEPARVIPLSETGDHTPLVKNPEFAGVLLQKLWIDTDVQRSLCGGMDRAIDEIVRRIDQEIRNTS